METRVSTATKEVVISSERPTVLIGERINPTGKKKLAEALRAGDMEFVRKEALAQVQVGADILDVNVGTSGVDQLTLLPQVVQAVMNTVEVPIL
jgi:5-methyltetrahydrofolate--homocysteine methyltransferase